MGPAHKFMPILATNQKYCANQLLAKRVVQASAVGGPVSWMEKVSDEQYRA
jgi:hypothetical protein